MIRLTVHRMEFSETTTRGVMTLDGQLFAVTLEDRDSERDGSRFAKVAGTTAIPLGSYPLIVSHSPRFNCLMPLVCDVPDFLGIRIHCGATHRDTSGCILVADSFGYDSQRIAGSRPAFDRLMDTIGHCTQRGMASLTITHTR